MPDLQAYLDKICGPLGARSEEVKRELRQHIEQAAATLEAEGWSSEDAARAAIREFGDPATLASQLASVHRRGGVNMLRRVVLPTLLVMGVWLVVWFAPVLLNVRLEVLWAVPLSVFLGVRLCALRGGSRRECLVVGLSPLALLVAWQAIAVYGSGGPATLAAVDRSAFAQGVALTLVNLAAMCLAATWLCFWVTSEPRTTSHPAPPAAAS